MSEPDIFLQIPAPSFGESKGEPVRIILRDLSFRPMLVHWSNKHLRFIVHQSFDCSLCKEPGNRILVRTRLVVLCDGELKVWDMNTQTFERLVRVVASFGFGALRNVPIAVWRSGLGAGTSYDMRVDD